MEPGHDGGDPRPTTRADDERDDDRSERRGRRPRRGLHKSFGHLEVLKGVDMEVHQGEVVVIFGRSGSGKSTLLRCVNFLEDPTEGTIEVAGIRLERRPPHPPQARADPAAPAARGHGVPAVQPVPAHDRRSRTSSRARVTVEGHRHAETRARSGAGPARRRSASPTRPTSTRSGSRAVSSSASRSRGRWRWSPRSCSSTSRPRRWTPS